MKPDVLDGGIYGVRVEGQVEILELEMLSNESDIQGDQPILACT